MTSLERRLIDHLRCQHNELGRTYRDIAADYPGVSFATIGDIIRMGQIPKKPELRRALGLVRERRVPSEHEKRVRRKIAGLARQTRKDVLIARQK